MTIDLDTLREMLASAERMIPYYAEQVAKEKTQNAAMVAAGLEPMHSDFIVKLHEENVAREVRQANALRYVITYHEGGIFAPSEAAA